jgi:glycosyltransferase involved in cell wall biosynthesis
MVKPKVVILGKYFYPHQGGTEEYSKICAHALSAIADVHVVCFGESRKTTYEVVDGINVVRCGRVAEIMSQPISFSMISELRRLKPDLILYNSPNYVGAFAILLASPKSKIIVVHHSDVFGRKLVRDIAHPFHLAVLKRSDAVIVNSLRNVKSAIDLPPSDIPVVSIPLGLSETDYDIDDEIRLEAEALRARVPCKFIAGFIGRHVRYKGLNLIIESVAKTKDTGCLIVGDGPKRAEAERLAQSLGVSDRVLFLGTVNHRQKLISLQAMDVLLLPSIDKAEAFGLVQIEAQFLEKPVIFSDLPTGVRDITIPNISGLMVETGDSDSLVNALNQLSRDPAAARQMGVEGRKIALNKFTDKVFGARLNKLVGDSLSGRLANARFDTLRSIKLAKDGSINV